MQLELTFGPGPAGLTRQECMRVGARLLPLRLVRLGRARRYVLRLGPDGAAQVTIPRGGSMVEGRRFAQKNVAWLEKELVRHAHRRAQPTQWVVGTEILFRGEPVRLLAGDETEPGQVRFGTETVWVGERDLREALQNHLWGLARMELPRRVAELAELHGLSVNRGLLYQRSRAGQTSALRAGLRVVVRNQRSRWGSCSRRGTISLNWRLIQAPPFVCDYIILHELAHLKHMNHSRRFWREVERLCPGFGEAEKWLKQHGELLR